jgi:hypothetical protein
VKGRWLGSLDLNGAGHAMLGGGATVVPLAQSTDFSQVAVGVQWVGLWIFETMTSNVHNRTGSSM